jgi:hypothetical protein
MTSIAKDMEFHVSAWTQLRKRDDAVRVAHDQAIQAGCDAMLEECLAIADRRPDNIVAMDNEGNVTSKRIDQGYVAWAKNRVETRLKLLALWDPARFGSKAADTNVTVNIATNEQVARIGKELRLLRREAKIIEGEAQ